MPEQVLPRSVNVVRDNGVVRETHPEAHCEATAQWQGYSLAILDKILDPWTSRPTTLDLPPPTGRRQGRLAQQQQPLRGGVGSDEEGE